MLFFINIINSYYINLIIYILCTTKAVAVGNRIPWRPLRYFQVDLSTTTAVTIKARKTTDHAHSTDTQREPGNMHNILAHRGSTMVDGRRYVVTPSPISFYFRFLIGAIMYKKKMFNSYLAITIKRLEFYHRKRVVIYYFVFIIIYSIRN